MEATIEKNRTILKENGFSVNEQKGYYEIESFTDAGGDKTFEVEDLTAKCLREFADRYDLNEEVLIWWENRIKPSSLPFGNIKEHYEDEEKWHNKLLEVIEKLD